MKEAPLFVHSYDFATWVLNRLEVATHHPVLRDAILKRSLALVEAVTLALLGFQTVERARQADEATALLRLHVRLAGEKGLLDEQQYAHAVQCLADIGRQLGGWRRKLEAGQ